MTTITAIVNGARIVSHLGRYVATGIAAVSMPCILCRTITDQRAAWRPGNSTDLVGNHPVCVTCTHRGPA